MRCGKSLSVCSIVTTTLWGAIVSNSASAGLVDMDWANSVTVNTGTVTNPTQALGDPDALFASFVGGVTSSAEFNSFGVGNVTASTSAALATLLGVAESVVQQADFIALELNGGTGMNFFETSTFVFDDTANTLSVGYLMSEGASPAAAAIVGAGNLTEAAYESFFGISNGTQGVHYPFLLFDIDGNSSVNPFAASFKVTMSAPANSATNTPDVDALAVLHPVPEPSAVVLLLSALSLGGIGRKKWRRDGALTHQKIVG